VAKRFLPAAAERPGFTALRQPFVIDAERGESSAVGSLVQARLGGGWCLARYLLFADGEHRQHETAPEIRSRALTRHLEAPEDLRRTLLGRRHLGRHGDVDRDRRQHRADLTLVARDTPFLLPQQALLAASMLAAARDALLDALELEAKIGRDRNFGIDADRRLEPAADRDRQTRENQRCDFEAFELQPRANGPGRETDTDERKHEGEGGGAVAVRDLRANQPSGRPCDKVPDHTDDDRDVGARVRRAFDAAVGPLGTPAPRLAREAASQHTLGG
jgi:hypothetical protein